MVTPIQRRWAARTGLEIPHRAVIAAVEDAIAGWRVALGDAAVVTDAHTLARYQLNTSEFPARELLVVLRPVSVDEVRRIIAVARSTRVPVHPISTGRNWGFGSALPVRGPAALVELGRMERILEVDSRFRYAVIEPGVTQGRLADQLLAVGGTLKLNVTGAGPDTSIVGNVLDHGVGNLGSRGDDLLGLEVVLGNGDVVRTGLWHFRASGDAMPHYPLGLGPDLRGLFVQSSFGIVTKMVIRLHRVAPFLELTLEATPARLARLVDELRLALDDGLVTGYLRITDDADPNIRFFRRTEPEAATWKAQLTVRGTRAMRAEARKELERRFTGLASRIDAFDTERDDPHRRVGEDRALLEARLRLADGAPSNRSLERIASRAGKSFADAGTDLDRDRDLPGFLCANVSLPFAGEHVVGCSEIVRAVADEAGVEVSRFFGMAGPTALSGFFPFYFDRRRVDEVARAHVLRDELLRRLEAEGMYPMRLDIDSMGAFIARTHDGYWRTVSAIKRALDPDGIVSPGHYCAVSSSESACLATAASTTDGRLVQPARGGDR
jgi:4-cresol dehydrogenase (hydroxylating)